MVRFLLIFCVFSFIAAFSSNRKIEYCSGYAVATNLANLAYKIPFYRRPDPVCDGLPAPLQILAVRQGNPSTDIP
jgi:hypothetical protein